MITLHLGQREKQPVRLTGEEPPEFLDLGPHATFEIASPMTYDLTARLVSGGILVTGNLAYRISGECGRCLKTVSPEIRVDDITLHVERPETEEVDISAEVREEALLVLPYNLLCSPDCKGLCPKCGKDLNEGDCGCPADAPPPPAADSPWAALDQLKLK